MFWGLGYHPSLRPPDYFATFGLPPELPTVPTYDLESISSYGMKTLSSFPCTSGLCSQDRSRTCNRGYGIYGGLPASPHHLSLRLPFRHLTNFEDEKSSVLLGKTVVLYPRYEDFCTSKTFFQLSYLGLIPFSREQHFVVRTGFEPVPKSCFRPSSRNRASTTSAT